jgi:pyruvate carboxylase
MSLLVERLGLHTVCIGVPGYPVFFKFIHETPKHFMRVRSLNRAQKFLAYLGDLVVDGSSIKGQSGEPGLRQNCHPHVGESRRPR